MSGPPAVSAARATSRDGPRHAVTSDRRTCLGGRGRGLTARATPPPAAETVQPRGRGGAQGRSAAARSTTSPVGPGSATGDPGPGRRRDPHSRVHRTDAVPRRGPGPATRRRPRRGPPSVGRCRCRARSCTGGRDRHGRTRSPSAGRSAPAARPPPPAARHPQVHLRDHADPSRVAARPPRVSAQPGRGVPAAAGRGRRATEARTPDDRSGPGGSALGGGAGRRSGARSGSASAIRSAPSRTPRRPRRPPQHRSRRLLRDPRAVGAPPEGSKPARGRAGRRTTCVRPVSRRHRSSLPHPRRGTGRRALNVGRGATRPKGRRR